MYEGIIGALKFCILLPRTFFYWIIQRNFFKKLERFSFVSRPVNNLIYYAKLSAIKTKILWDTLNHYLLFKQIMRQLWRERQIVVPAVSLYLYSFWGREKYLINYEKKQILL